MHSYIHRESWENLEDLFGKQDELRGHLLENELVALHPSNFEIVEKFFTKFKSLALQCKQCIIERKDEKNVLSILRKFSYEYSNKARMENRFIYWTLNL